MLCFGITPDDHDWLQAHAGDVEACAEYLHGNAIACALAHPFYAVAAPLTRAPPPPPRAAVPGLGDPQRVPRARAEHARRHLHRDPRRHRSRRVRRPRRRRHRPDLHRDAAGVDSRRVSAPPAPRRGDAPRRPGQRRQVGARGDGAGGARARPRRRAATARPARRADHGRAGHERGRRTRGRDRRRPRPRRRARAARAWLDAVGLDLPSRELLAWMQDDDFSHADLFRRARRAHERGLREAVERGAWRPRERGEPATAAAARGLFDACIAGDPVRARRRLPRRARRASSLARERRAAARRPGRRRRRRRCTASRTRSTRSASAACPASRSR